MRISTRHSFTMRLLLCLLAALLLALPSTALARGVKVPTRAFAPGHVHGKAKPKRGKQRHVAPQRVIVHPVAHKAPKRPVRPARPARPIGSATLEGQKPTTAPAPVAAAPAAAAPAPAPV